MSTGAASSTRRGPGRPPWLLPLLALWVAGCLPLPVHVLPPIAGQVLDDASGEPLPGAIVVVRFDARHGDLLPERDLLGHREVVTDAAGRFQLARAASPGFSAWPFVGTEARVVGVMKPGYRCGAPARISGDPLALRLSRSDDEAERRASCRPVAARPDEAPEYLASWRALYPRDRHAGQRAEDRSLERVFEARRLFGPGGNCSGPAVDLALAPGGERVAIVLEQAGRRRIEVVSLVDGSRREARMAAPPEPDPSRPRRLAWASGGELLLWEPADALDRTFSPQPAATSAAGPEVVWRGATAPARRDPSTPSAPPRPVLAAELNDEGDARWRGRSFRIARSLDPLTGLAQARLRTHTPAGQKLTVPLPGEPCGPPGQYGRPHYRIAADGERGVDLRYVDGGCRAIVVHLTDGQWTRLDSASEAGVCAAGRRVPSPQLRAAMRSYVRDLEEALGSAGADPRSAYQLQIGRDGLTTLQTRDVTNEPLELTLAPFPIETPLSRIDVTGVANTGEAPPSPSAAPAPAPEPL